MGREKTNISLSFSLTPLRPEVLLVGAIVIVTLAFVAAYVRLFYEYRQTLAEKERVATLVAYEETRRKDLEMLEALSQQEGFRQAESVRIFSPAASFEARDPAEPLVLETGEREEEQEVGRTYPVWQEWLRLFHLRDANVQEDGGNRQPE